MKFPIYITGPEYNAPEVRRIPPGTEFEIIDGPVCNDHSSWWKIRIPTGRIGWVMEGSSAVYPYFLCPKGAGD
ncbi:MAG: SH3 domain-containing protein [Chloroflexi bacterium]|nr:SH3 domain-containing protein [Chloroflexota bacterium]